MSSPGTITFRTYGYAGGMNAAGQPIAAGGFDPVVTLFQGVGPLAQNLSDNNDDTTNTVAVDPSVANAAAWDSLLTINGLPAGDHTLVRGQAGNVHGGGTFSDPFS